MNRLLKYGALGVMMMSVPAFAGSLTFTTLQYNSPICGGNCSFLSTIGWAGINDNNVVATSFAFSSVYQSYTYNANTNTYSAAPVQQTAGKNTIFAGINNAGLITGFSTVGTAISGFTYNGSSFSSALSMPANTTFTDGTPNPFTTGTIASTFINGIQEQGNVAVGFYLAGNVSRGFVYNPANPASTGAFSPFLCATTAASTNAYSVNDNGKAVGYCKANGSGSSQQGFIYDINNPNTTPTLLANSALATAVSDTVATVLLTSIDDAGDLAGWYTGGANGQNNGFFCKGSLTYTNCSVVNVVSDLAGVTSNGTEIFGINNNGSIVGAYTATNGSTYAYVGVVPGTTSATPEPATIVLSALPILGLVAFRYRRGAVRK